MRRDTPDESKFVKYFALNHLKTSALSLEKRWKWPWSPTKFKTSFCAIARSPTITTSKLIFQVEDGEPPEFPNYPTRALFQEEIFS